MSKFDIKEVLKSIIGTNSENDENKVDNVFEENISLYNAPSLQLSIVDSFYKIKNPPVIHYFSIERSNALNSADFNHFNYLINPYPIKIQKGVLNTPQPVKNIKSMRLSNIYITINDLSNQLLLKNKKLAVLIKELSTRCFISNGTVKYHFILEYVDTINGLARFSTYDMNRGLFEFDTAIKYLDELTVSVYDGTTLFPMEPNEFIVTPTTYLVYTLLAMPANSRYIYTPEPITLWGFSTTTPVIDAAIINSINTTHTVYRTIRQTSTLAATIGEIQVIVDNILYLARFVSFTATPNIMDYSLISVNYTTGAITSLISANYTAGTVVSNNHNTGYLTITSSINVNLFSITAVTTDGIINSQITRTYAFGVFNTTLNNVPAIHYIRLPIDTSTVTITTPSITLATTPSKLEMQLELICEG